MDSTKLKIEAELAELEHSNHGDGGEEEEGGGGGGSDRIDLSVGRSPLRCTEEKKDGGGSVASSTTHTHTYIHTHSSFPPQLARASLLRH